MAESPLASAEAKSIVTFGRQRRLQLQKIKKEYNAKGSFGLRWDSKVSTAEKEAWWYFYLFTFRSVSKEEVINEIEKYIKLYEDIEKIDSLSFDQIDKMDEDVKEAMKKAKTALRHSNSSTVCGIINNFLSSNIDSKIEKIKNAVGTHEFKKLQKNFDTLVKKESEKWKKEYQTQMDELKKENEKQASEHKKTTEDLEGKIKQANSRLKLIEKATLKLIEYAAGKDPDFLEEFQNMLLDDKPSTVEGQGLRLGIEGPPENNKSNRQNI